MSSRSLSQAVRICGSLLLAAPLAVISVAADAKISATSAGNSIAGGDAIIGGDRQDAIIGGDRQNAIIGGDIQGLIARGVIAKGPVEALDSRTGYLMVLGQAYRTEKNSAAVRELQALLQTGATVTAVVSGAIRRGTPKATAISFVVEEYVPGVTPVFLIGKVDRLNLSTAEIGIRGLSIDRTSLLSAGQTSLAVGDIVLVTGSVPARGAALTATSITGM